MRHYINIKSRTINGYKEAYKYLLHHRSWRRLRANYLFAHDHCEVCGASYKDTILDVHHVVPISDGKNFEEMRVLAYKGSNMMCLCRKCHCAAHKELRRKHAEESDTSPNQSRQQPQPIGEYKHRLRQREAGSDKKR